MSEPQYIAVEWAGSARRYTYHNEGEPVAVGDQVKLPVPRDPDQWQRGTVVAIDVEKPEKYATKAILGLVGEGE